MITTLKYRLPMCSQFVVNGCLNKLLMISGIIWFYPIHNKYLNSGTLHLSFASQFLMLLHSSFVCSYPSSLCHYFLQLFHNDDVNPKKTIKKKRFLKEENINEVRQWVGNNEELDWEAEFDQIDEDKDGKIFFEDFIR